jgi:hypothetical protein
VVLVPAVLTLGARTFNLTASYMLPIHPCTTFGAQVDALMLRSTPPPLISSLKSVKRAV